ncbi:MAG: head maturation protease, ClpP-related [Rubrivivax sp.]
MKKLMQLLRDNAAQERQALNLVRAESEPSEATLYLYDVIDAYWGISAQAVAQAIAGLGKDVTLHLRINSPGGDVFEAEAMATAIRQHPGKTVAHIDGLAASAATRVASAASEVEISEGSFYMIHNAWTITLGDKRDMTAAASLLDKVDGTIVADYARRTGETPEQIAAWMNDETWFTAQEAVDHKFADRVASGDDAQAKNATPRKFNLTAFDKTPKALLEPPKPAPAQDIAAQRAHNERRLRLLQVA